MKIYWQIKEKLSVTLKISTKTCMHNATAITTGSANQRSNTPCISLWIDVTFRGLEDSYWKKISRSFALINFKASATATFKLAHIKDYMAMTSTWNRTCFPNPPGCCIYRLPYEQVGPDIKGSRWVAFLLPVTWNWHLHTASGQRVLILFISHSRGDRYRQC